MSDYDPKVGAIRHWLKLWKLDDDLCRCRGCGRGVHISRLSESPNHSSDCPFKDEGLGVNPWAILAAIITTERSAHEPG